MTDRIVALPGDGIVPEVVGAARELLDGIAARLLSYPQPALQALAGPSVQQILFGPALRNMTDASQQLNFSDGELQRRPLFQLPWPS